MAPPVNPRLLREAKATQGFVIGVAAVGVVQAFLMIAQASVMAGAIAHVFYNHNMDGVPQAAGLLIGIFAVRGALTWLSSWLAQRASAEVKSSLRRRVMAARLSRPDSQTPTASLVTTMTSGLDAIDGYFGKYLPQFLLAATVPIITGVALGIHDLTSLIIVIVTIPLIPLFMVLIGWTTSTQVARRYKVNLRLANYFADLVAGLPTLQVFGRARAQSKGLRQVEDTSRRETMATLRIAFLSAGVLELMATLSVALIAVTIGFRAVAGDMDLRTALYILILAPEVYLPIRMVGVHFHDSANGNAAAEAAYAIIDAAGHGDGSGGPVERANGDGSDCPAVDTGDGSDCPGGAVGDGLQPAQGHDAIDGVRRKAPAGPGRPDVTSDARSGWSPSSGGRPAAPSARTGAPPSVAPSLLAFGDVVYRYPGAEVDAVGPLSLTVGPGEIVALAGPSGAGKTTALEMALGVLTPSAGRVLVDGGVPLTPDRMDAWRAQIAWAGQTPGLLGPTVADDIALGLPADAAPDQAALREALDRVGGENIGLDHNVGDDGEALSAGERRRVALARALLRVEKGGAKLLLLDEPTAGLDEAREAQILTTLRDLGVGVLVVSHREAVLSSADRVIEVAPSIEPDKTGTGSVQGSILDAKSSADCPESTTERDGGSPAAAGSADDQEVTR